MAFILLFPFQSLDLGVLSKLWIANHVQSLKPAFKIFSSSCDDHWRSNVITANGTHWSSVFWRFEVSCFLYLQFYKNHVLPSRLLPNLITHAQQVLSQFGTTYCCEHLFSKMKHAKSILHLQLSNYHLSDVLLLSTSSFNPFFKPFFLIANSIINNYLVNCAVVFCFFVLFFLDCLGLLS